MTVQEADAMHAMARGDVGGSPMILCELYHPTMEFASYGAWNAHNKAVHLGCTFIVNSNDGGRAEWAGSSASARPCIPQPRELLNLKHGPDGSGRAGPCEPDCRKCASESAPEPIAPSRPPIMPRLAVCAVCGLKPGTLLMPDGWAGFTFPIVQGQDADLADAEHQQLCPPCGEKVAKFITHVSTPMLHEEDLL